ncbi:MAG TPA: DUF4352 domain-containing protein [Rubrobacter sp.]|nr:DUF4352 domain-containing protein [Rubrobacter sp.]
MADGGRPVYCARCGGIVDAGDSFCGSCGARLSPAARDAAPAQGIPAPPNAQPRASGDNRALPLILGLAAVVVVLAGIGAIVGLALVDGTDADAPRASASEPAPADGPEPTGRGPEDEASDPPMGQALGVGDSVEAGGVEATLNGVRVLPATNLDEPTENPDNRFLAADLTFENVSEGAVPVSGLLGFVLKNEEGYSASQTVHSLQKELAGGEIGPGRKASGEIVYEVPPESRGLQLDYRPTDRGGTYTWDIGDLKRVAPVPRPPETTSPDPGPTSSAPPISKTEIAGAAEDYYKAVDRENWAYTYANLDAATRALYPEDEWYLKNQYFADTEGLDLAAIDVIVEASTSDPEAGVTVYRTFEDGTSIDRFTLFVREAGAWKHRFTAEENAIFQPGVPYEEFVAGGGASAGPN